MIPQHQDLIALNNMAVQQLEEGDFKGVNRLLSVALRLIMTPYGDNEKASRAIQFSWSKGAPIPRKLDEEDEHFGTFIYSRGVLLKDCKPNTDPTGEEKSAILYNAALVAHLLAMQTSESLLLRRAQALYIHSRRAAGAKSTLYSKHFFHVAILNNLGQISYELADHELSKAYFLGLKATLHFLMRKEDGKPVLYSRSDLLRMLSNFIMESPITAPCA